MSAPRVRRAGADDVARLVGMMAEFYAEAGYPLPPEPARAAFQALLEDPRLGGIWIGEAEGEAAGYLVLTLGFSMEYGGPRGFVDDFFVRPAARGKGLGAAILAEVRRTCRAEGVRALLVETGLEGHPARRLYERAGFSDSGRALLSQALAPPLHEDDQA
jgi:GNAT superfamily N-acetyltransferase